MIDGLWRCLCPSYDGNRALQLTKHLGASATRPRIHRTPPYQISPSKRFQARSSHGGPAIGGDTDRGEHFTSRPTPRRRIEPSRNGIQSRNASWDDLSVAQLQDVLSGLKQKEGEYHKLVELVKYLLNKTGEKPNLLHYDALISGNSNASLGSAVVVAKLLQDVKEEKVVPDSRLYHSALQVLHLLYNRTRNNRWISLLTISL